MKNERCLGVKIALAFVNPSLSIVGAVRIGRVIKLCVS